jgi:hypothetical protein
MSRLGTATPLKKKSNNYIRFRLLRLKHSTFRVLEASCVNLLLQKR